MRATTSGQAGSASVMGAAAVAVLMTMTMLIADAGRLMAVRMAAQTAADAAALAAAPATFTGSDPVEEAGRWARINGARLTACRCPIDRGWRVRTVTVEVVIDGPFGPLGWGSVPAVSSAELDPVAWLRAGRPRA